MRNAADQTQQFLDRLRAIEAAVRERTGQRPREVITPTAPAVQIASVELELGVSLPEEVNSLYGATGSVGCYINFLAPVWRLVELNEEARLDIAEVYADFGHRIWGPEPEGRVVAIGSYAGFLNLCEVDGPSPGRLSMLNVIDDFGYRFLADSVGDLLDAWLAATKGGLFDLAVEMIVGPADREAELRSLANEFEVGPAAFGVLHLTPDQMDRMRAGAPDYWT